MSDATKVCRRCGVDKPRTDFSLARSNRDGLYSYCKECARAQGRAHYIRNREAVKKRTRQWALGNPDKARKAARRYHLAKYGLTAESFASMLERQGGRCAACRTPDPSGQWHVDHDHSCCGWDATKAPLCGGCNRGVLCPQCNKILGLARDDPGVLGALIGYLTTWANP